MKEIQDRFDKGYNMTLYGTREFLYEQMLDDIESLLILYSAKKRAHEWKHVSELKPPKHVEVLAKSPDGVVYIASWRDGYKIFTCQDKSESSYDWQWKQI